MVVAASAGEGGCERPDAKLTTKRVAQSATAAKKQIAMRKFTSRTRGLSIMLRIRSRLRRLVFTAAGCRQKHAALFA